MFSPNGLRVQDENFGSFCHGVCGVVSTPALFHSASPTSSSLCTGFLKYSTAEEPLTFAVLGSSVWYFCNPSRLKQLISPCSVTINCFHFQGRMARKVSSTKCDAGMFSVTWLTNYQGLSIVNYLNLKCPYRQNFYFLI